MSEPISDKEALQEVVKEIEKTLQDTPTREEEEGGFYLASLWIIFFNFLSRTHSCFGCAMRDGQEILDTKVKPPPCDQALQGRWGHWVEVKEALERSSFETQENLSEGRPPYSTDEKAMEHVIEPPLFTRGRPSLDDDQPTSTKLKK